MEGFLSEGLRDLVSLAALGLGVIQLLLQLLGGSPRLPGPLDAAVRRAVTATSGGEREPRARRGEFPTIPREVRSALKIAAASFLLSIVVSVGLGTAGRMLRELGLLGGVVLGGVQWVALLAAVAESEKWLTARSAVLCRLVQTFFISTVSLVLVGTAFITWRFLSLVPEYLLGCPDSKSC